MRIAVIITGLFLISFTSYAQQGRQMQKPGATVQNNGAVVKKPATVQAAPVAPRQMAPLGNSPVATTRKPSATPVPANSQSRQMKPLDPNTVVKKNN